MNPPPPIAKIRRCSGGASAVLTRRRRWARGRSSRERPARRRSARRRRPRRRRSRTRLAGEREVRVCVQLGDLERHLDDGVARRLDAVGAAVGTRAHGALEQRAAKVQRDAVVGREAGAHAGGDEAVVLGAARGLGVVVHAVGVGQQPQAAHASGGAVEGGQRFGEPAQRPRGGAAQDDAPPPRAAQDGVKAVRAPGAEHRHDVAAPDVDEVLGEQMGGEVVLDAADSLIAAKQRHVRGVAVGGEAAVEAHDVMIGVAGGGRQEAHPRAHGGGEREDVVVEQRGVFLHREAAAAEGHDLGGAARGSSGGSHRSGSRGLECVRSKAYPMLAAACRIWARGQYGPASEIRCARDGHAHIGRSANN